MKIVRAPQQHFLRFLLSPLRWSLEGVDEGYVFGVARMIVREKCLLAHKKINFCSLAASFISFHFVVVDVSCVSPARSHLLLSLALFGLIKNHK
jgi:hypothetical protein